jgi:hypothetical protein
LVGSTAGKIVNAVNLVAASSDSLSHADNTDLRLTGIDASISCWVNLASKPSLGVICGKYTTSNFVEYLLAYRASRDRFEFLVGNGTSFFTAVANTFGSPSIGVWYFIKARIDNTAKIAEIGVNNGAFDSVGFTGNIKNGTARFYVGRRDDTSALFLHGAVDELGIWKRKLASEEFASLYNSGNGLSYDNFTA